MALAEGYAMQFLEKGRIGWDVPHTRAVVHYAKLITRSVNADLMVIPTAAWLHDIGYYGLFKGDSGKYEVVQDRKARHMIVGAEMAREFVDGEEVMGILTPGQRDRVVHLVSVHDRVEALEDLDEIILMEADTLGAIDVRMVRPTFDKEGRARYVEIDLNTRRGPRFRTSLGKELLAELIPKFLDFEG
jgi:putative nucleotidyltransferase with HDIG domain